MASIRMFTFSYDSLCIEWPTGIEGRVLPLWRRTALRLNLDESVKSRQSRGMWLILSVYIMPSISLQATKPLSILKKWTRSSYLLQCIENITHHLGAQCWHMYPFPCYALSHTSCIMKTGAKNWILRPYLVSARLIEEESTILVMDTFCVLTSVIWRLLVESALIVSHKEWLKWMHHVHAVSLFSTLLVFEPVLVNLALKGVEGNTTGVTGVTQHVFV
jgi:hypothetical protein